jgi:hypothetical protein
MTSCSLLFEFREAKEWAVAVQAVGGAGRATAAGDLRQLLHT